MNEAAFSGRPSQIRHEPIVPEKSGQLMFVVACLDCGFAHDAAGSDAGDAIAAVAPTHDRSHHLIARRA